MKPLAKIIVRETAGIRRFLYPLMIVTTPAFLEPSVYGQHWRVCELDGTLLPSLVSRIGIPPNTDYAVPADVLPWHEVHFALSLAPYEQRELLFIETEDTPRLPDPLQLELDGDGECSSLTSRQERVSFHVDGRNGLDSVVYDSVEHLQGTLLIGLEDEQRETKPQTFGHWPDDPGLLAQHSIRTSRTSPNSGAIWTHYWLTACKSWVNVEHKIEGSVAGKTLVFSLPLRPLDETPTCDFGVGNGVYEKIGGDAVVWTTEFGESPYAKWRVSTVNAGEERIDYQGECATPDDFAGRAWFHWIEKTKALAVAIPGIHHYCDRMTVSLARDGKIGIAFAMSQNAPAGAHFSVCYHFLNDIPAIAAATNPASILLPPTVEIQPLS